MNPRITKFARRYAFPAILALGVLSALPMMFQKQTLPEGLIQLNGRLEAEDVLASTQYAGKVVKLEVDEGDRVEAGQVVARLDDSRLQQQLQQAKDSVAAAGKQVEAASLSLQVKKKEMPLSVDEAKAGVARASAELGKAEAVRDQALREVERARKLEPGGTISQAGLENAQFALTTASLDVTVAEAALTQARAALSSATLNEQRLEAQQSQLEALQAERDKAVSAVAEIDSVIADYVIKAPMAGVVETKLVSPGETLAAGTPLFDIVDLKRLYLKAYVPGPDIGKIRLGLKARVFTDTFLGQPFDAAVTFIASRAQFTPKEVQTQDERVKEVFEVKLSLDENPGDRLSPGMPADAVIRWKDDVAWKAPLE